MFKIFSTIVVILAVALLGFAATKPDEFRIERSTSIKATPEKVFALVNDFKLWEAWSPWEKKDPVMKRVHSGEQGKGAKYSWQGNSDVGSGSMEIIESIPPSKVLIKLDFIEPFEGHNITDFTFQPEGDAINVTWAMYGPTPFVAKVMQIFFSMDSIVGKDFEAGLANLKAMAEK